MSSGAGPARPTTTTPPGHLPARRRARPTPARGGGPALAPVPAEVLRLQRAAGNRAVRAALAAPVVQRTPAQPLIDKRLAVSGKQRAVIDGELVPMGEAPGRFDGFPSLADALAVAKEAAEISVVVRDPARRFHVLRTDRTSVGGPAAAPTTPKGWVVEQVVQPSAAAVAADEQWSADHDAAQKAAGDDRALRYRQLVERWTEIPLDQVAWAPGAFNKQTNAPSDLVPGKVNVAAQLPSAGRHVPGQLEVVGSAEPLRSSVIIATSTFDQGPVAVRATLLHEQRHAYHAAQAVALMRQWRGVRKADTMDAWQSWLKTQRRKQPLADEVYLTAWAMTSKEQGRFNYGKATTELYSYVRGLMYALQRMPAAALSPDRVTGAQTQGLRAAMAIGTIGVEWEGAGEDARKDALRQLVAFLKGATANHREHVRRAVQDHQGSASGDIPKAFYKAFLAALGSG